MYSKHSCSAYPVLSVTIEQPHTSCYTHLCYKSVKRGESDREMEMGKMLIIVERRSEIRSHAMKEKDGGSG